MSSEAQPDHAWKVLDITNEWIRHADAKVGVTLAFVGGSAALLAVLVGDETRWTPHLSGTVSATVVALVLSIAFAGVSLFPRVRDRGRLRESADGEDTVNLLFYGDIKKTYGTDRPSYRDVLATLSGDPDRLTRHIADQIHANAHIAMVKFRFTNWAIRAELIGVVGLAAVVILIATGW